MCELRPDDTIVPQVALLSLMGSSHSYIEGLASSTLVGYQLGKTSLPEISSPPPHVDDILDSLASDAFVMFEKDMMPEQSV